MPKKGVKHKTKKIKGKFINKRTVCILHFKRAINIYVLRS